MSANQSPAQNRAKSPEQNPSSTTESTSSSKLSGVRRYKKGRSFSDTLFGKMRYGKDLVTGQWVAIKENRKWFAQNRVSMKGDPVPEDLFAEIKMMEYLMQQRDVPVNILRLLDVVEDDVYIYLVLELVDGGDFFAFIHAQHQAMESGTVDILQQKQWEKRMRGVFYQIGTAIKWLHCHNVCHLDLSLENALIDHQ